MLVIYIDADACPVKAEIARVAERYGLKSVSVSNQMLRGRPAPSEQRITVGPGFDEADDKIAELCEADDIVITSDIKLAARCIQKKAHVLAPTGKPFTPENIGSHLAMRELNSYLREAGEISGYNAPFTNADRSRFLQEMDKMIQGIKRRQIPMPL